MDIESSIAIKINILEKKNTNISIADTWFSTNNPWFQELESNFKILWYCFLWWGKPVEMMNRVKCLLQAFWRAEGSASEEHGSNLQEWSSSPRSSYSHNAAGRQSPLWFSASNKWVFKTDIHSKYCVRLKFSCLKKPEIYRENVRVIIAHLQESLWTGGGVLWSLKRSPRK